MSAKILLVDDDDELNCFVGQELLSSIGLQPSLAVHAFADDRAVCLAAVMNNYLAKPFTLDELKKIIYKWTSTARLA